MRRFNVTGPCIAHKHYMVDISAKLEKIKEMIDYGDYFTINRARQYGKTTTLTCLGSVLKDDYIVASMSFENLGDENFESADAFCATFARLIQRAIDTSYVSEKILEYKLNAEAASFERLSGYITEICRDRKVVLMIDEVDKSSNNRVYLHFLAMLRDKYIKREQGYDYTFHSVILAGVHDVRNLKLKLINDGAYTPVATEGKLLNSPWNIAVEFDVDMSFCPDEIATMLREYEKDHNTGMDIAAIAEEIHSFTSGYPFLVSRICQCIDEKLSDNWTHQGVLDAVKLILNRRSTLFDDLFKNLESNKELYELIYDMLILGNKRNYAVGNPTIDIAEMYGIIKDSGRGITVANRIFEIVICEYFISKDEARKKRATGVLQYDVVKDNRFDMELCLVKFAQHYAEIFSDYDSQFLEREGRLLFLTYLRPLINGEGFYHIESQFTDLRRMDLIVDYAREQFILELKLWKGEAAHEKAYEQLAGYLASKGAQTGYLLTFDFRKGETKQPRAQWVEFEGKRIFDVVV